MTDERDIGYFPYHQWERCLYQGGKWHTICRICGIEGPDRAYGWYGICEAQRKYA